MPRRGRLAEFGGHEEESSQQKRGRWSPKNTL